MPTSPTGPLGGSAWDAISSEAGWHAAGFRRGRVLSFGGGGHITEYVRVEPGCRGRSNRAPAESGGRSARWPRGIWPVPAKSRRCARQVPPAGEFTAGGRTSPPAGSDMLSDWPGPGSARRPQPCCWPRRPLHSDRQRRRRSCPAIHPSATDGWMATPTESRRHRPGPAQHRR